MMVLNKSVFSVLIVKARPLYLHARISSGTLMHRLIKPTGTPNRYLIIIDTPDTPPGAISAVSIKQKIPMAMNKDPAMS